MIGLLRKDLFNLSAQLKIYLFFPIMVVFFCIWQKDFSFPQVMLSLLIIFVPLSAFAYDEMCDFQAYALTLPISKKQLVTCKYVLSLILTITVIVLALSIGAVVSMLPLDLVITNWVEYATITIVIALMMNGLNCIMLPLMFKYGSEKSRVAMMILFFSIGGVGYLFHSMGMFPDLSFLDQMPGFTLVGIVIVMACIIECISILVSDTIMKKKEF